MRELSSSAGGGPSAPSLPSVSISSSSPTPGEGWGSGSGSMTFLSSGFHSPVTGRSIQHDHQFTASLLRHGFYQDNTLTAATKSKERHLQQLKKNQQSMDRLVTKFNREARQVHLLQRKLAHRQQAMAYSAQQKFAVPYLQAIFRGFLARKRCKQRRSVRLIEDFYKFKLHFRRFVARLRVIQHGVLFFLVSRRLLRYAMRFKASRRLQRWYHRHWLMRRAVLRVTAMRQWNHVTLFGITRAVKRLLPLERYRYVLYRFLRSFLWQARLRRLLHPLSARIALHGLFLSDVFSERHRALRFHLCPSRSSSSSSLPCSFSSSSNPSGSFPEALMSPSDAVLRAQFQRLQRQELRRSTLQTLCYVLRAQRFKCFPFPSGPSPIPLSVSVPPAASAPLSGLAEEELLSNPETLPRSLRPPLPLRAQGQQEEEEEEDEERDSPETLRAFQKLHRRSLRVASASQLDTEALFYLGIRGDSWKHCPVLLRDLFRLRSLEDVLSFLHCLSAVLRHCPSLLSPSPSPASVIESSSSSVSLEEMLALAQSPNAAVALKRKRVFKFPTTTLVPFGGPALSQEDGANGNGNGRKVRFQRRGGALLLPPASAAASAQGKGKAVAKRAQQPKAQPQAAQAEPRTKAEQIREQKALLAMAAGQARQVQRKLDIQSGNVNLLTGSAGATATVSAEDVPLPSPLSVALASVSLQSAEPLPESPVPCPSPVAPSAQSQSADKTQTEEATVEGKEREEAKETHLLLNLSLSSSSLLLSPLPSLPLSLPLPQETAQGQGEEGEESDYEDDFEEDAEAEEQRAIESRRGSCSSSRPSSRRCLTPRSLSRLSSPLLPPLPSPLSLSRRPSVPSPSRPSSSCSSSSRRPSLQQQQGTGQGQQQGLSPSRPEGPAPSHRRSFREIDLCSELRPLSPPVGLSNK